MLIAMKQIDTYRSLQLGRHGDFFCLGLVLQQHEGTHSKQQQTTADDDEGIPWNPNL